MTQAGAAALATLSTVAAPEAPASGRLKKKGCCGGDAETLRKLEGHWYYTWWAGGRNDSPAEFVPMIKNIKDLGGENAFNAIRQMAGISHLLGYNEPERKDQGNIPLDVAVKNWPRLVELAKEKNLRLGSPAPSSDGGGMAYFHAFMERAKKEKLHMDFIAMHWYRGRDPGAFANFLDELGKRYKLPIWVTEFNGWSGSEAENYKFLRGALRYMDRSRHIERYAYFEPGRGKPLSLFKEDGSLTRMGEVYREAGA